MMDDAQPVQALRSSCLRDRAIAGVARKNNAQREYEQNATRKRGRRCGTANSALGKLKISHFYCIDSMIVVQPEVGGTGAEPEKLQNGSG